MLIVEVAPTFRPPAPSTVRASAADFVVAVPSAAEPVTVARFWAASAWAWRIVDWADWISFVIESRPLEAEVIVCTAFDMPSSRFDSCEARSLRPDAVKKFTGLSTAELTFLPVARRYCAACDWAATDCREVRALRTPAERETLIVCHLLVET